MRPKNFFGGLGNHQKHPAGFLARRPEPRWPSSQRCGWHDPWLQHRLRAPPAPRCINDVWMVYERCMNDVLMVYTWHDKFMVYWWFMNGWSMTDWAISMGFHQLQFGESPISNITNVGGEVSPLISRVAWIPHDKHSPLSKSSQFHPVSTPLHIGGLNIKRMCKT